ncbi:MAG: T9SS type B sorting domain-containing protein, partial [Bacteroidota bacterium]
GEPFNGTIYPQSTSLIDTLTNWQGFDSLVLTNLFVHPASFLEQWISVCEDEPFNGIVYPNDVLLTQNLTTNFGCDSTIVTHLDVIIPVNVSLDTTICDGETYLGWQAVGDTVVTSIFMSAAGCDSLILQANLHVSQPPLASISGKTSLCNGETSTLTAYGGASYLWSNGEAGKSIEVSSAGNFSVTVVNDEGCQDVASAQVSAFNLTAQVETIPPTCEVGSDGSIVFSSASGGTAPYFFSVDGGNLFTTQHGFHNLLPGNYEAVVEDKNGCQWTQLLTISDPGNLLLELGEDQIIRLGETVQLEAFTNILQPALVQWSPAAGLSCADCLDPIASPAESTTYRLTLTDQTGCAVTSKIRIVVQTERQIFVPTAFSPNGDGINDRLLVFAGKDVATVRRFAVFDRWGELLFSVENALPNDPAFGWDGRLRGKEIAAGVFSWLAEVEFVDGAVERFTGEAAIIK